MDRMVQQPAPGSRRVMALHSDNCGKFLNNEMKQFLAEHDIDHRLLHSVNSRMVRLNALIEH
eukprot:359890-Chlamydomonas_euryale.AAC.2